MQTRPVFADFDVGNRRLPEKEFDRSGGFLTDFENRRCANSQQVRPTTKGIAAGDDCSFWTIREEDACAGDGRGKIRNLAGAAIQQVCDVSVPCVHNRRSTRTEFDFECHIVSDVGLGGLRRRSSPEADASHKINASDSGKKVALVTNVHRATPS